MPNVKHILTTALIAILAVAVARKLPVIGPWVGGASTPAS